MLAGLLCGQPAPSPGSSPSPERNWYRVTIPGPQGDYIVWGWPEPTGGIRYEPSEQAPARARLNAPAAPAGIGSWATNGVTNLQSQAPGTITTNAVPGDFSPNAMASPDPPHGEPDTGPPPWLWPALISAGVVGMAGVGFVFFVFVFALLIRRLRQ